MCMFFFLKKNRIIKKEEEKNLPLPEWLCMYASVVDPKSYHSGLMPSFFSPFFKTLLSLSHDLLSVGIDCTDSSQIIKSVFFGIRKAKLEQSAFVIIPTSICSSDQFKLCPQSRNVPKYSMTISFPCPLFLPFLLLLFSQFRSRCGIPNRRDLVIQQSTRKDTPVLVSFFVPLGGGGCAIKLIVHLSHI